MVFHNFSVEEIYQRFIILERRRSSTRQSNEMQQFENAMVSSSVDDRSTIAPDVPRDMTRKFEFTRSVEHSTPITKNDVTQPSPMPIDETPKRIVNDEPHPNKGKVHRLTAITAGFFNFNRVRTQIY